MRKILRKVFFEGKRKVILREERREEKKNLFACCFSLAVPTIRFPAISASKPQTAARSSSGNM